MNSYTKHSGKRLKYGGEESENKTEAIAKQYTSRF